MHGARGGLWGESARGGLLGVLVVKEQAAVGVRERTSEGEWVTRVINAGTNKRFLVSTVPIPGGGWETAVFESLARVWFPVDFQTHIRAASTYEERVAVQVHDLFAHEFEAEDPSSLGRLYRMPDPRDEAAMGCSQFDELDCITALREETGQWVKETDSTYDDLAREMQEVMEAELMCASFAE